MTIHQKDPFIFLPPVIRELVEFVFYALQGYRFLFSGSYRKQKREQWKTETRFSEALNIGMMLGSTIVLTLIFALIIYFTVLVFHHFT